MSPSIRSSPAEALPHRGEGEPIRPATTDCSGFGEILNQHLDDPKEEVQRERPQKESRTEVTPWTILGILAPPLPIPLPIAPPGTEVSSGQCGFAPVPPDSTSAGAVVPEEASSAPASTGQPIEGDLLNLLTPMGEMGKITAKAACKAEEIAGKIDEKGEKGHGIRTAKQPAMLLNLDKNDSPAAEEQRSIVVGAPVELRGAGQMEPESRPTSKTFEKPIEFSSDRLGFRQEVLIPSVRSETSVEVQPVKAVPVIDSIREHVQVLRTMQSNELHVVLRPDAHTELLLQIRNVDGQVQVQARCERGDFHWLDSQWNAVQNALGNQGVRVEPLQAPGRAQDQGASPFMQDRGGSQREGRGTPMNFSFEQECPKSPKSSSRPAMSGTRNRGWQSWA